MWKSYKLKEFLSFYSTNSLSRSNLNYENGNIKNIHYGDIHTKFPSIINCETEEIPYINLDIDSSRIKEDSFCKDSDLIIADASENYDDIGKAIELINVGNQKIVAGLHTILARDTADITVSGFKGYLFQTDNLKKQIKIITNGISVLGISKNNLKNLYVNIPSKEEQEKIVRFLFLIDRKIDLLEKTLGLYEKNKKYFIENIFSQKLRFEGFPKEWDFMYLKDIGTFFRGHSYNSNNVVEDGLLVLRSNNIQNGKLIFDKDRLQFVNKPCNDELKLIRNDIVICMSNGTKSLVGKTAQYDGSYPNELTVGAFCSIFRSNAPLAKYIFQTEYFKKYLYILLAGTNINNIKNSDLEKFIIKLPGYEEQEKITKFLNNFNKKIELIKLKKEKYENYKKSLLQNMFV